MKKRRRLSVSRFSLKVKHITPIEEAVALAAIKKFRLKNQLGGNGDEAEEEEDEDEDVMERLKDSEEEIEEELEKEHGMEAILNLELDLVFF